VKRGVGKCTKNIWSANALINASGIKRRAEPGYLTMNHRGDGPKLKIPFGGGSHTVGAALDTRVVQAIRDPKKNREGVFVAGGASDPETVGVASRDLVVAVKPSILRKYPEMDGMSAAPTVARVIAQVAGVPFLPDGVKVISADGTPQGRADALADFILGNVSLLGSAFTDVNPGETARSRDDLTAGFAVVHVGATTLRTFRPTIPVGTPVRLGIQPASVRAGTKAIEHRPGGAARTVFTLVPVERSDARTQVRNALASYAAALADGSSGSMNPADVTHSSARGTKVYADAVRQGAGLYHGSAAQAMGIIYRLIEMGVLSYTGGASGAIANANAWASKAPAIFGLYAGSEKAASTLIGDLCEGVMAGKYPKGSVAPETLEFRTAVASAPAMYAGSVINVLDTVHRPVGIALGTDQPASTHTGAGEQNFYIGN